MRLTPGCLPRSSRAQGSQGPLTKSQRVERKLGRSVVAGSGRDGERFYRTTKEEPCSGHSYHTAGEKKR